MNTTEKKKIKKKIGKDFANELDFYDYKKTEAKFRKIDKEQKLNEFPPLCLKHAPKNYLNIAHEYLNYDGSKINNYLCNKCYPRND